MHQLPTRRIVTGWDGSGSAENALLLSIDLAERHGAELEIVHGVSRAHRLLPEPTPAEAEQARQDLALHLESSLAGARLTGGDVRHELLVAPTRHPAELVLSRAADADLVVLGRHQRHGLLDLDDTVRGVLSQALCPVWVQSGPARPIHRILVPVDLSEQSLVALHTALGWARLHDATVTVVHCFHAPEPFSDEGYAMPGPTYVVEGLRKEAQGEFETAMAAVDWQGVDHNLRFVDDEPVPRILRYQASVDLVVMATHGHTGFHGALMGHVADMVIRHGHGPVLALRDPDRSWLT